MQKISIKNFGPIKDAIIEINNFLILIGEQASGKSTIAKLIYFFKSLPSDFLSSYYASDKTDIDIPQMITFPTREKFYDYFGSTFHLPDFKIVYYYGGNKSMTLSLAENRRLYVSLGGDFFPHLSRVEMAAIKKELLDIRDELSHVGSVVEKVILEQKQIKLLQQLSQIVDTIFCNTHNDSLFVLAGRNATVGYSGFFEEMLNQHIRKTIENQGKQAYLHKEQTIDETLMLEFLQKVNKMRQQFNKYGDFAGIIRMQRDERKDTSKLELANGLISKILRGSYSSYESDERIVMDSGQYVYLKNASSGQQESIRILQDAFLSILSNNNVLRIFEEPEVHLFPEAQMYIMQLLAIVMNNTPYNQIIITTHSPYVLSVLNNLIYAYQIGQSHTTEVNAIIDKNAWLNPERVKAYMLSDGNTRPIIDAELKMIQAEHIDSVSSILNDQFNNLLDLDCQ